MFSDHLYAVQEHVCSNFETPRLLDDVCGHHVADGVGAERQKPPRNVGHGGHVGGTPANDEGESELRIGTRKQGQEGTGPAQGLGQAGEDRVQVDVEQLVKEVPPPIHVQDQVGVFRIAQGKLDEIRVFEALEYLAPGIFEIPSCATS
jgi:hypothetical protein